MKCQRARDTGYEALGSRLRFESLFMDDTETVFMKRALELASRGAGLVSPNPMVGAVLVKDGRVVGEGFHRYDRLRHAESYALEMAGELARGSTLYCNLEPCCHHGRTPPCTDSVIEAGISRAVIATIDPDVRVCGRGIEQMRAAGIDVEVGLREEEALRLNESYLKYVTKGVPFAHAIIVRESSESNERSPWKPSSSFLRAASEYDLVALGTIAEVNTSVIEACLSRERHRRIAIAPMRGDLKDLPRGYDEESVQIISPDAARSLASDLASAFSPVAERFGLRSILALPGSFGIPASSVVKQADKITVIARKASIDDRSALNLLRVEFGLDLDAVEISDANGFVEVTGYPRRGRARVR